MIRNKKGSHVDVVLSFVIFIMFVLFIFILVVPSGNFNQDHKQTLEYLKLMIESDVYGEVLMIDLVNSSSRTTEDCISLDESGLEISGLSAIAKNFEGDPLDSYGSGTLEVSWVDESAFRIIYSDGQFNSHIGSSGDCQSGVIKSTRESEEILESKILTLISNYDSDYDGLKEDFRISNKEDFNLQFDYGNETVLGSEVPEVKTEIYAEKYQISYLDKEANRRSGYFLLYVWG